MKKTKLFNLEMLKSGVPQNFLNTIYIQISESKLFIKS